MRAAIGIYEHPDFTLPKPTSAKQAAQSKLAVTGILALISATAAAVIYVVRNAELQERCVRACRVLCGAAADPRLRSLKARYLKH